MYVCISISASMWSTAERASAPAKSWLCEGWCSVLRSFVIGVFGVLGLVLFVQGTDMPWLSPWICVLLMAATSSPDAFRRPTRWEISLCVGCCKSYLWSGCHNASSYNCCSGPDARIVGRELLHLKSCMRDGACFGLPHKGECCVNCPGLILNFAGQCCVLAAFAATLHWMRWTSSKWLAEPLQGMRRSVRGAWKMSKQSFHAHPLAGLDQALGAALLPGFTCATLLCCSLCLLSFGVHVTGCCVAQATWPCIPATAVDKCPQLSYPDMSRVPQAALSIACCIHVWVKRQAQLQLMTLFHTGWAQKAATAGNQERSMVERLAESSSGEFLNLLDETADSMDAEPAAPAEAREEEPEGPVAPAPTRVIRDRLGQIVREPPGPPPGYVAPAEAHQDDDEGPGEPFAYESGSEGDADEEGPGSMDGPPRGPPPPNPSQEVQSISLQLSANVAQTLALTQGQVLTVLPPYWRDLRRVRVEIRGMVPSDMTHPHVMHLADDRPPGLAARKIRLALWGQRGPYSLHRAVRSRIGYIQCCRHCTLNRLGG